MKTVPSIPLPIRPAPAFRDPTLTRSLPWIHQDEFRGIHFAAYYGHAQLANLLLKHGTDHARKVDGKYTPLHYAVFFRHYDTVSVLVREGADPIMPDDEGRTPIGRAVEKDDAKMIAILRDGAVAAAAPAS